MPISSYERKVAPWGDEPYTRVVWTGPATYVQVAAGTPPTGGDPIIARTLGVSAIIFIDASASSTGNFNVVPIRIGPGNWALKWVSLVAATVGGQAQTVGAEAAAGTNLSAEQVRLQIGTMSG